MHLSSLPRVVVDYLPPVVAGIAAVLSMVEISVSLKDGLLRKGQAQATYRRNWTLVIGSTVATLAFFFSIFTFWEPKDEWTLWRHSIGRDLATCRDKHADKISDAYPALSLDLDCLSLALARHPLKETAIRTHDPRTLSGEAGINRLDAYLQRQRAGYELLHDPETAAILAKGLGIRTNLFLGSGHTLPYRDIVEKGDTISPGIREYLVRNYCVGNDENCPEGTPGFVKAWGWEFDPISAEVNGDALTIGALIERTAPNLSSSPATLATWATAKPGILAQMRREGGQTERIFIRFAEFPKRDYKGTFARPSQRYAFFTDARDVWSLTYRQATEASGRLPDLDHGRGSRAYLWLVAMDPTNLSDYGLATWDYVLQVLGQHGKTIDDRKITL